MTTSNFLKNITSRDIALSQKTIKNLIKTCDVAQFKELCEKSDFIFPFIKERITTDFIKQVEKTDIDTIFEFSKTYSDDFSDLIVGSLLKFASEDLTDSVLELLDTGTPEQKAYLVLYFTKIKDTLALDSLNESAKSDFSPLKINCAKALLGFSDTQALQSFMDTIKTSNDEFEKLSAFEFICAYKTKEAFDFVIENAFNCAFLENIILNLLNTYDFEYLKNNLDKKQVSRVFQVLLESYPENNSLNTLTFYQIYDYILFLKDVNSAYSKNILLKAKSDFSTYLENDIYSYDLDKNNKDELNKIVKFLAQISPDNDFESELTDFGSDNYRFTLCLEVIKEQGLDYSDILAQLLNNNKLDESLIINTIETIKAFKKLDLIDKKIVDTIKNENIKMVVLSSLN